MYKVSSDLAQRRARQLWLSDLQGTEFQSLTLEQQRDNLKAKLKSVQLRRAKQLPEDEHLALGMIMQELQQQIHAIRPKMRAKNAADVPIRFVEVARERLSKTSFDAYMAEANLRAGNSAFVDGAVIDRK